MKAFWILAAFAAILVCSSVSYADFMVSDKPTFDVSIGKFKDAPRWDIKTMIPIFDGYAGVEWVKEDDYKYINSRLEQRYKLGSLALAGYSRYTHNSQIHDPIMHFGVNVEWHPNDNIHFGLGTWTPSEDIDLNPRAHIGINFKHFSFLAEGMLERDKNYTIRFLPHAEIPIVKLFFIEQISLVFSAKVEYFSAYEDHIDYSDLNWSWSHRWRLPF